MPPGADVAASSSGVGCAGGDGPSPPPPPTVCVPCRSASSVRPLGRIVSVHTSQLPGTTTAKGPGGAQQQRPCSVVGTEGAGSAAAAAPPSTTRSGPRLPGHLLPQSSCTGQQPVRTAPPRAPAAGVPAATSLTGSRRHRGSGAPTSRAVADVDASASHGRQPHHLLRPPQILLPQDSAEDRREAEAAEICAFNPSCKGGGGAVLPAAPAEAAVLVEAVAAAANGGGQQQLQISPPWDQRMPSSWWHAAAVHIEAGIPKAMRPRRLLQVRLWAGAGRGGWAGQEDGHPTLRTCPAVSSSKAVCVAAAPLPGSIRACHGCQTACMQCLPECSSGWLNCSVSSVIK